MEYKRKNTLLKVNLRLPKESSYMNAERVRTNHTLSPHFNPERITNFDLVISANVPNLAVRPEDDDF